MQRGINIDGGNIIEINIEKIVLGGDGLARLDDGQVLFIPFTLSGEKVKAQIIKKEKNLLRGKIVEIIELSADRVEPKCPYFGKCGGCQYQHIKYETQCRIKQEQVVETLTRIGKLDELELQSIMQEISPSPKEWNYRNRIILHRGTNGVFGYYSTDNETIIPIDICPISNEFINSKLNKITAAVVGSRETELVISGFGPEWTNIISLETRVNILNKIFVFGQKCFLQANLPVFEDILKYILSKEILHNGNVLLELYCGIGIISIFAAEDFKQVYASDINSNNIGFARKNVERHGVKNVRFSTADAAEAFQKLIKQGIRPDTVILDPPREGVDGILIEGLKERGIENIIYISCNPATFARDTARLSSSHSLVSLKPFDMFPQTSHIELVGIFKRK